MATVQEAVRRLSIVSTTQGVTETTDKVRGLVKAQEELTVVSQKSERATQSAEKRLESIQKRYDQEFRAQKELAKVQRDLDTARGQGLISQAKQSELMQLAIKYHNGAAQQATLHARALQELQSRAMTAASGLGSVGTILSALGPVGLVVGASLGVAAFGLKQAADASLALADRAGKLKDFAETTGFTVIELQALEKAGAQVGVSSESVTKGLEKFSVAMDDVKQATGPVYDALVQIDPQLARQIARTKSAAAAWDLFAIAARKADLEQRNVLARQAFGRGGIELTRLQSSTAEAGGIKGLIADLKEADRITAEQADRWDTLGDKINENMKAAKQNIVATFAGPALDATQTFSGALLEISRTVREIDYAKYESFWSITARGIAASIPGLNLLVDGVKYLANRGGNTRLPDSDPGFAPGAINAFPSATPSAGAAKQDRNAETIRAANELRAYMAVLGDAATPTEQLKLKQLELAAAVAKNATVAGAATRAEAEAVYQKNQSIAATKIALGVASEEEIITTRLKQVRHDAARAGITDAEQLALANRIATKEAKEAADAQKVRASSTPGLTSFILETQNLDKQLDTLAVGGLNNMTAALTDITMGTVSAKDGFRNLGLQVIRSLEEMIIKMLIIMPIARGLQTLLGGGWAGGTPLAGGAPIGMGGIGHAANGLVLDRGSITPFAFGGVFDRPTLFPMENGTGLMGEAGPEAVMPLRRGSDGKLGVSASGGGGGDTFHFSSVVQIQGGANETDQQQAEMTGRAMRSQFEAMIDDRIRIHKRSRGLLAG